MYQFSSVQLLSCVQLCDAMDCSMPGFPVHHQLLKPTQTHVHPTIKRNEVFINIKIYMNHKNIMLSKIQHQRSYI